MKNISIKNLDEKIKKQKEIYEKEIENFYEIGKQFQQGFITSNDFKKASGGMGVYAQRGGKNFMIRLRVPSGVVDIKTLKLVREFANYYRLPDIHLTTREAIQLHNLDFDHVIEIMRKSLEKNVFTRGSGGNFPRNVSLSPLSGVDKEEAFDVTPYALLVNKYFLSQMNIYKLPRKFKVAFSNSDKDTAFSSISDLGLLAVKQNGKKYFKLFIGGSLGSQGDISVPFDELISPREVLYHVEACVQLLTGEGDFENRAKGRMRFIVKRMGREGFLKCYKEYLKKAKMKDNLYIKTFPEQRYESSRNEMDSTLNLILQKQKDLFTVQIHPRGGILKTEILNKITDYLQHKKLVEIRLSSNESMYVRNLSFEEAKYLLEITKEINQSTRLEQSVSCIGTPTCQIGIGESQTLLENILNFFEKKKLKKDILPSLHISGCMNSCARHQVSEIGFHCKKRNLGEQPDEIYSIHIGGVISKEDTTIAKVFGEMYAKLIPEFLYELAVLLEEKNLGILAFIENYCEEFENIVSKYVVLSTNHHLERN